MAVYENGKMDVLVGHEVVQREYTINKEAPFTNRYVARVQCKYVPFTHDNEEVVWVMGSDIPYIVQRPVNNYKDDPSDMLHPNFEEW